MDGKAIYDVIVIGGGLAGLTTALHLGKSGCKVLLIEKYNYPHHKVCGEYVSNEVLPYLKELGTDPFKMGAVPISKFEMSGLHGKKISSALPLGGFGISRYALDHLLYEAATEVAQIRFQTVNSIEFQQKYFRVGTSEDETYHGNFVVGAFGKRSLLDGFLNRKFIQQKSPWLGVKAHFEYDLPSDTVALHNFEGGYCGLSKVESGAVNACYLTTYKSFQRTTAIDLFQDKIMSKNPHLKDFFQNAKPLFAKPLSISQISFEKKQPVESHIFMVGDSAGLIHPLCGNGMAMAIHSAKIFCELFLAEFQNEKINRFRLESDYTAKWKEIFTRRLQNGRRLQNLLLQPMSAQLGLKLARMFPSILPTIIKKTHGDLLV